MCWMRLRRRVCANSTHANGLYRCTIPRDYQQLDAVSVPPDTILSPLIVAEGTARIRCLTGLRNGLNRIDRLRRRDGETQSVVAVV